MTSALDRDSVLAALSVAVRAPSIHNTQPWAWRLRDGVLEVRADRSRQLAVADPDGHSLILSCGAALHLTEIGLRASGWDVEVQLLPDAADADLLARITGRRFGEPDPECVELAEAALRRRSDRRPFRPDEPPAELLDLLAAAGSMEHVSVEFPPRHSDERINLAVAVSWADRIEREDEAYLAEMNRWLRDPDVHAMVDGVPVDAFPHVPDDQPRHLDVPQRDYEVGWTGRQLIERGVDERPMIGAVITATDAAYDHLLGGISMMRMMLAAEQHGLSTCVLSQAVDFAAFRTRVQGLMGWVGYPQMMMRVGYPTAPTAELAVTPRRSAEAVLQVG
ncbi:MAG: Acg family FMN-binding oxidoreductase [Jatrophihabitans sp.]|uniref:Acg family FMN-binding oxidoreductase n=1 Tax=Jatrophihabitans sp. TaxID=1932789 RepID=UPI003F7D829B